MIYYFFQLPVIVFLSCFSINCFLMPKTISEIERHLSPNGKTEVIVQRVLSRDVKYISLLAKTDGKKIKLRNPLYFEKDWDGDLSPNFESVFQVRKWINTQTFFINLKHDLTNASNFLLIKNNSNKIAEQVVIFADGHYIIYNMHPNQEINLPVSWRKYPNNLNCKAWGEAYFNDNTSILLGSNEFKFTETKDSQSASNCGSGKIIITNNKMNFTSY